MRIERKRRSMVKAISWRALATLTTMTIVYLLTGKLQLTLLAGGLDVVFKMILYYFHERAWNQIMWGKRKVKPFVLWFTGLSGSGKTTLANAFVKEFQKYQELFERLDGDVLREIFPKTGFSKEDRNMHIRRAGYLAALLERNGVPVICSFISPYSESRQFVREKTNNYIEVFVNAPLTVCEERDPKGLYKKARDGQIKQFTGIDDPYEPPENPEIVVETDKKSVEECVQKIMGYLLIKGYIA